MPNYDELYWREEEDYNRQCELEYEKQQADYYYEIMYQESLRQEEIENYPLFFWRETCEPILDLRKKTIL